MKEKFDLVKFWVEKAENDLLTAQHSLSIKPKPPYDTICFHAQQCAEKYLKAFLVFHEREFEKVHDLGELIKQAMKVDKEFSKIISLGVKLTPYAVEVRYPSVLSEELTAARAKEAIEQAIRIKKFILGKAPLKI